jgi:hypothetical protein
MVSRGGGILGDPSPALTSGPLLLRIALPAFAKATAFSRLSLMMAAKEWVPP